MNIDSKNSASLSSNNVPAPQKLVDVSNIPVKERFCTRSEILPRLRELLGQAADGSPEKRDLIRRINFLEAKDRALVRFFASRDGKPASEEAGLALLILDDICKGRMTEEIGAAGFGMSLVVDGVRKNYAMPADWEEKSTGENEIVFNGNDFRAANAVGSAMYLTNSGKVKVSPYRDYRYAGVKINTSGMTRGPILAIRAGNDIKLFYQRGGSWNPWTVEAAGFRTMLWKTIGAWGHSMSVVLAGGDFNITKKYVNAAYHREYYLDKFGRELYPYEREEFKAKYCSGWAREGPEDLVEETCEENQYPSNTSNEATVTFTTSLENWRVILAILNTCNAYGSEWTNWIRGLGFREAVESAIHEARKATPQSGETEGILPSYTRQHSSLSESEYVLADDGAYHHIDDSYFERFGGYGEYSRLQDSELSDMFPDIDSFCSWLDDDDE
ncbi:MAG: hypothetical protein KBH93_05665 [Anaerolineae bacterium]|nr:hypothetical protein [Anaerolineae bacterium]